MVFVAIGGVIGWRSGGADAALTAFSLAACCRSAGAYRLAGRSFHGDGFVGAVQPGRRVAGAGSASDSGDHAVTWLEARDNLGERGVGDAQLDRLPAPVEIVAGGGRQRDEGLVADPAHGFERDAGHLVVCLDFDFQLGAQAGPQLVEST